MFRRPKKCHIVRTAERLQTFELFLNPIYNILDFQLFSNLMIACCSGRALARTGFTLVMTSTECTPRIAKKRWWSTIRKIAKSRNDNFIMIIYRCLTRLSHFNIQGTENISIAMCYIMMKIMMIMVMIICLGGPI